MPKKTKRRPPLFLRVMADLIKPKRDTVKKATKKAVKKAVKKATKKAVKKPMKKASKGSY